MIKFDVDYKSGTHAVYKAKLDPTLKRFVTEYSHDEPIDFFVITTKEAVNREILDELATELYPNVMEMLEGREKIMVVLDALNLDANFTMNSSVVLKEFQRRFKCQYVAKVEIDTMLRGRPEKGPAR